MQVFDGKQELIKTRKEKSIKNMLLNICNGITKRMQISKISIFICFRVLLLLQPVSWQKGGLTLSGYS